MSTPPMTYVFEPQSVRRSAWDDLHDHLTAGGTVDFYVDDERMAQVGPLQAGPGDLFLTPIPGRVMPLLWEGDQA